MVISHLASEDLHLAVEASKRTAVNNAVSIPLEWATIRVNRFGVFAPLSLGAKRCIRSQQLLFTFVNRLQVVGQRGARGRVHDGT